MINFNGVLTSDTNKISISNRALNYGDGVFETIKYRKKTYLFLEDHYFRLMSSMRILRMDIPMFFTLEFFETELNKLLEALELKNSSARIKLFVYRNEGGLYTPKDNTVSFVISAVSVNPEYYEFNTKSYVVDLYKDHYVLPGMLSTLKTNNKVIHVLAGVYAKDNDYDNCLLLNSNKKLVEANNGNLFLVIGDVIKTPPLKDGCLNGIMRKQLLRIIAEEGSYTLEETSVSPFELQKADELFITNVITGIQPVTRYRKKIFKTTISYYLLEKVNKLSK